MITLIACSSHNSSTTDAMILQDAPPDSPLDAPPDAPPTLDCPTYCAEIGANCAGTNSQYADDEACLHACETFAVGTSTVTDMSGNTLGCRIYHAGAPSKMSPEAECPRAGPAGDIITASPGGPAYCSGGDFCTTYCTLEIAACGTISVPLPGNPHDSTSKNPVYEYIDMADCIDTCPTFDRTHVYNPAAVGDSFACRLAQSITALVSITPGATMHCSSTALNLDPPSGFCFGTPTP